VTPPMKLSPPTTQFQERERQLAEQYLARRGSETQKAPWLGISRDLPQDTGKLELVKDSIGLVARADPNSGGEVLINDGGFTRVDPAHLPLGSGTDRVVSILRDFPLVDSVTRQPNGSENTQGIAITSRPSQAAPLTGAQRMYRLDPGTTFWTQIPYTTGTGSAIAADEAGATVDGDATISASRPSPFSIMSMVDAVVFPRGVPGGRVGMSTDKAALGVINQPVFVWTNNLDPVFVYPRSSGTLEYEPLTNQFGVAGDPCDFRCVSLEVFADRVNFFNTMEGFGAQMVRRRNRLRWSARGTADPDPAQVGASSADLDNFSGQGVKIKRLGNAMACYLQDGVAIVSQTGQAQSPYSFQNLDERRGLLSTHGLVSVSQNEHFGVFDDGWWFLNSSGQWRKAGVVSFDGRPVEKWRTFFYSNFNRVTSHRLQLYYDEQHNWVRMAVPDPANDSIVTEEWIYEIDSDRVWKDTYTAGLSCWGDITMRDETALIWSAATQTWASILGTWGSFGSSVGQNRVVHGTEVGLVHFHDDNFITRDGNSPIWSYEVVPSDLGREQSLKAGDRITMEHIDTGNTAPVAMAVTTGMGTASSQNKSLSFGTVGATVRSRSYHHINDEHLGLRVAGSGTVEIRSFTLDYVEDQVERVGSG